MEFFYKISNFLTNNKINNESDLDDIPTNKNLVDSDTTIELNVSVESDSSICSDTSIGSNVSISSISSASSNLNNKKIKGIQI